MIEEKFQPSEIAVSIAIFARSLESIKKRMSEMKSREMRPTNLNVFYKSQRDYEIYLEKLSKRRQEKIVIEDR